MWYTNRSRIVSSLGFGTFGSSPKTITKKNLRSYNKVFKLDNVKLVLIICANFSLGLVLVDLSIGGNVQQEIPDTPKELGYRFAVKDCQLSSKLV